MALITRSIVVLFSFVAAVAQAAEANRVSLDFSLSAPDLAPYISYLRDPSGNLTLAEVRGQKFLPLENEAVAFGFTPDKFWLRFEVVNTTESPIEPLLRTSARFMRPLEIFLLRENGETERLLYNDETQPFGVRPVPELRFLATPFNLAAGESATFYVRFGAGGQAAMSLQISSREAALREQSRASVGITIYGSILLTLILVNLFYFVAIRKLAYLLYVFYESFNLLYVSHLEGFTFQYLWSDLPQWNDDATPMIASIGLVVGNLFAMVFLQARKYAPVMHKIFLALIAYSVLALLMSIIVSSRVGNQLAAPMLPVSIIFSVIVAAVVQRRGHYLARYFLVAWSLFALSAVIWSGSILGLISASFNILTLYKSTIALQAIILSMGLADQARRLNQENVATQKSLIASLQGRLEDARERLHLEHENERTMLKLLEKSKQLAATSHDINQPIQSLRLALKALQQKSGPDTTAHLEKTLDHMESVLGGTLDQASADLKKTSEKSPIQSLVAGSLINDMVSQFSEQAREKDLELRGFNSRAVVVTRELPLKRCLMNLVSNAINNTESGGVLIGARRLGKQILFQVIDTGRGIPEEEIDKLKEPLAKGSDSDGYGLGLAIIKDICAEYGWTLSINSRRNYGSCFTIAVPVRI
jgi:signal transduction histidine kinase